MTFQNSFKNSVNSFSCLVDGVIDSNKVMDNYNAISTDHRFSGLQLVSDSSSLATLTD